MAPETLDTGPADAAPPEPGAQPPSTPPAPEPPPEREARGVAEPNQVLSTVIGMVILIGPLLYWAWGRIPGSAAIKWVALGLVSAAVVLVYIFLRAKQDTAYRRVRDGIIFLLTIPGAAIACLYFAVPDQALFLKLFAVVYLSFLPPWLYLQFISNKGKALWEEYVLNLFRLRVDDYASLPEPPVHSPFWREWRFRREKAELASAQAPTVYQRKFEGVFGPVQPDATVSFRGENLAPVVITTILLSVGWVLVVQPETVFGFRFFTAVAAYTPSGLPAVPLETLRFGFLGTYFYILQMLVRRYFQNDLKTSAYVYAATRVIVVALTVWALEVVWLSVDPAGGQAVRSGTAFAIGVFPDMGWQILVGMIKWPLQVVEPSLRMDYPLSDLDGLNLWYQSRLLEEGIEDMQNLVTANLVDVMLNTRVPVDRLVDWIDQAVLYLHLGKDATAARATLRGHGIRTATDLEDVLCHGRASHDEADAEFHRRIARLLNAGDDGPSVLECVCRTFRHEPNLFHVKEWRAYPEHRIRHSRGYLLSLDGIRLPERPQPTPGT